MDEFEIINNYLKPLSKKNNIKNWKRKEVLFDPKFYLISLVMFFIIKLSYNSSNNSNRH